MWQGKLEAIYIASAAQAEMRSLNEANIVAGEGVEGDRYAQKIGTFSQPSPDREVTLIEAEAIEAMQREYQIELAPGGARRNLITRGVPLNHLVGKEFRIGGVKARGIRLCEPCAHLETITGQSVIKGLRHRGGLRAQVVAGGTIRVGDLMSE